VGCALAKWAARGKLAGRVGHVEEERKKKKKKKKKRVGRPGFWPMADIENSNPF
jgi:hypothetical protein